MNGLSSGVRMQNTVKKEMKAPALVSSAEAQLFCQPSACCLPAQHLLRFTQSRPTLSVYRPGPSTYPAQWNGALPCTYSGAMQRSQVYQQTVQIIILALIHLHTKLIQLSRHSNHQR